MIVVDASVAVKWLVQEPGRQEAMRVFDSEEKLGAPDLIFAEVANVLGKKVRRKEISRHHAVDAMTALQSVPMQIIASSELANDALALALDLDHSAYDCFYLACSLGIGPMLTADEAFARKCAAAGFGATVVLLSAVGSLLSDRPALDERLFKDVSRLSVKMNETFDALGAAARNGDDGPQIISGKAYLPAFDSPAYRRLSELLKTLPMEQLVQLIALGWLGRSYCEASQWAQLLAKSQDLIDRGVTDNLRYIIAQMPLVSAGLEKLRASLEHNEG